MNKSENPILGLKKFLLQTPFPPFIPGSMFEDIDELTHYVALATQIDPKRVSSVLENFFNEQINFRDEVRGTVAALSLGVKLKFDGIFRRKMPEDISKRFWTIARDVCTKTHTYEGKPGKRLGLTSCKAVQAVLETLNF